MLSRSYDNWKVFQIRYNLFNFHFDTLIINGVIHLCLIDYRTRALTHYRCTNMDTGINYEQLEVSHFIILNLKQKLCPIK